ncbi:MAG: peptide deformylase [Bacteroidales bacterium]|nr:peptide deformylase [Bacteroidales bacterium]
MTIRALSATAIILTILLSVSCNRPGEGFTDEELSLINGADSIMRVLTIEDSLDNAVLRSISTDMSAEALSSPEYERLVRLMVATVTHPSQDGVGIAGPQVGLNRRVVAVQRFDKPGEPFEVYPNIRIVSMSDSLAYGPEGCLSVPDRRGEVLRSQEIVIEYADIERLNEADDRNHGRQRSEGLRRRKSSPAPLPVCRDTVKGFTAVIFQHECDHLDGVLYIDRL